MTKNILVIAAHPDDELLGCGGTVAKHVQDGDIVTSHIISEGVTSRKTSDTDDSITSLRQEAFTANEIIGVKNVHIHHFPDNKLDTVARLDLIQCIEAIISEVKPDIIYTHHVGDVNIDHQRIHEAVVTATRPLPNALKPTLLFFEIQSSTEWQPIGSASPFTPNWFVNISNTLELKIEALNAYKSEMRPWPHSRSCKAIEHLARWRGACIGIEAAEAFMLGRHIINE